MNDKSDKIQYTLENLGVEIGAELIGDGSVLITGVNTIDRAGASELCFLSLAKMKSALAESQAGAVLVSEHLPEISIPQLVVGNVDAALIDVLNMFTPELTSISGIHPTVIIHDDAVIADGVSIGPNTCIARGVNIASGCIIGPNCSIGENTAIGENTRLDAGIVIYHNCSIGRNCLIQAGVVIGAIGYGYSFLDGQHKLVPHNGGVIIEDCVDIGANSCVDRAKFGNTVIGAGTKLDNLVQIGHGCIVGKCCLLTGQVGLAGSTELADGVVVGGQSGIADNLKIGAGAMVAAHSGVMNNLEPGAKVAGVPAIDIKKLFRQITILDRLPKALKEFKEVAAKVDKLEASENDKK